MWPARLPASRILSRVGAAFVVLLGIRFFASVTLSALAPTSDTLAVAGRFLEAYEVVLPAATMPVTFLLTLTGRGRIAGVVWLSILGAHVACFLAWLAGLLGSLSSSVFAPLAVAIVILTPGLVFKKTKEPRALAGRWWGFGYLALLVVIPLAFALRAGAALGLGTSTGPGGILEGSWLVSNLPTLLVELFAIGVWLAVVLGASGRDLRRRWFAFVPLAAVPLLVLAFWARPLTGYVFSATVTWGSNLALFVPPTVSLAVMAVAVACYLSTFLLVPRAGQKEAWGLLVLGTLSIILAGFYVSMASIEGLVWGSLLVARGLWRWNATAA